MNPFPESFWAISEGAKIIIVALLVLGVLGGAALKIIARKIDGAAKDADAAVRIAGTAVELSRPTGNGFARGTTNKLDRIVEMVEDIQADVRLLKSADRRLSARLSKVEKAKIKREEPDNG